MAMEMSFRIVGGKCDGETVTMQTFWDGRGHRPPPVCRMMPREPLPLVPWPEPDQVHLTETFTPEEYHLHVFDEGSNRWYEYRPERQAVA